MFNKYVIWPYGPSTSARLLSRKLSPSLRIRANGNYHYYGNHLLINWGNSASPAWLTTAARSYMLNKPLAVGNAADKVRTFQILAQRMPDRLPDWCTELHVAREMVRNPKYHGNKHAILCRTLTRASEGRGIVLAENESQLVSAPLYTRYIPKSTEYRIHVSARFGIMDKVQKRRRNGSADATGVEKYIRSHDNGWVFCHQGVVVAESILNIAKEAVDTLGLDFGAVDIGHHPEYGTYVYEVNTAPGIEGQTLDAYANTFRRYLQA